MSPMRSPLALLMAGVLLIFYIDGFVLGAQLIPLLAFALLGLAVAAGFVHHGDHGPAGDPHPKPVLIAAIGALAVLAPVPLAAVWLGASFVGMTAPDRLAAHPYPKLLVMGLLFGAFMLGFEPRLAWIGGDLGATAAVSVFAVLGAQALVSRG